jgi:hypothetical protein
MSLVSDIQSKLKHGVLADKTLTAGTITAEATASIDTKGANALSLALSLDRALAGNDALTYKFQDSPDNSAWSDLAEDGNLPYSAGGAVANPVSGQIQNVGCFSSERYVRVVFNGVVDTTDLVVSLPYVLEVRNMEADQYLTKGLPNDGQP